MPSLGLNAAFAVANTFGVRLDPYMPYNFLVEIDGLLTGGFQEVHGLEIRTELQQYAEGGVNGYAHQIPGETRYPNLVLSHGLTDIDTLWNWYESVRRGVIQRRNMTLMVLDRQRIPVMWWDIREALPVRWAGPSFDAQQDSEVAVETVELVHKGIVKPALSKALALGRGVTQLTQRVIHLSGG
ncbi:phage tail protein [Pyxidicoccus sp. 3LG]